MNYEQPQGYPGGPPAGQYPGGPPQMQHPGQLPGQYLGGPADHYSGDPNKGQYPGGPPAEKYQEVPPATQYQGGPLAGKYSGGPPQGGHYPPQGQGYPPGGQPPVGPNAVQQQWQGEMPEHDVYDNPNAVASQPTAPPLDKMDVVQGYQNIGFDGSLLPPPSYAEATREPPQRSEIAGVPKIDEREARQALLDFVAENCCYGKGVAENLQFTKDLVHTSAFHYTLETFGEERSTAWAFTPYLGEPVDGPHNGPAPRPWDVDAKPPNMFQNHKAKYEVPHTASVKPCHDCMAMGRIRCYRCYGRGTIRCSICDGKGHKTVYRDGEHKHERCDWCYGEGKNRCIICDGYGTVTCNGCQGHCQIKCYIKLTIHWTNHLEDHIVERTALPSHLIRNVQGQSAFQEQQPRVWPINHFPDSEINSASQRIVSQHATAFPTERILMQRHQLRIIPVTQAYYKWKGKDLDYFVYGFDKKVYAPTYPQKCCCGCTVL